METIYDLGYPLNLIAAVFNRSDDVLIWTFIMDKIYRS